MVLSMLARWGSPRLRSETFAVHCALIRCSATLLSVLSILPQCAQLFGKVLMEDLGNEERDNRKIGRDRDIVLRTPDAEPRSLAQMG